MVVNRLFIGIVFECETFFFFSIKKNGAVIDSTIETTLIALFPPRTRPWALGMQSLEVKACVD